jgi:hypothetical protein
MSHSKEVYEEIEVVNTAAFGQLPAPPARGLLNFAVNHFALSDDAAFIRDDCIPTPFVFQILQSHIVPPPIKVHFETQARFLMGRQILC